MLRGVYQELADQAKAFVVGKMCGGLLGQRLAIEILLLLISGGVFSKTECRFTWLKKVCITAGVTAPPTVTAFNTISSSFA